MTIQIETFYGGSRTPKLAFGSDVRANVGLGRVKVFSAGQSNLRIFMPDATIEPLTEGGPVFYLLNVGSFSVDVVDFDGAFIAQMLGVSDELPDGTACIMLLADNSTQAGRWYSRCRITNDGGPFTTTTTTTVSDSDTPTTPTTPTTQTPHLTPGCTPPFQDCSTFNPGDDDPDTIFGEFEIMYITRELVYDLPELIPATKAYSVSLIMAELNEGPDLENTILTALEQDVFPQEIIVVDDCSIEVPNGRLSNLPLNGTVLSIIENERSLGCGASRHLGCKATSGEVVVVCDSHMRFPKDWLSKMLACLELYPNAIITPVSVPFKEKDNGFWGTGALMHMTERGWSAEWFKPRAITRCPRIPAPMGACYMLTREMLDALGGWGPGLRGWGLDEEYLALRAYTLGYEVRLCLDVEVEHHYGIKIDRDTRCGLKDRRWEVLYNQQVVRSVLFADGNSELREQLYNSYEHLRLEVEQKLVDNYEELAVIRNLVQSNRICSDVGLSIMLDAVEKDRT